MFGENCVVRERSLLDGLVWLFVFCGIRAASTAAQVEDSLWQHVYVGTNTHINRTHRYNTCTLLHTYPQHKLTHAHTNTHRNAYTQDAHSHAHTYTRTHTHAHARSHTHTHTHTHTHGARTHTHTLFQWGSSTWAVNMFCAGHALSSLHISDVVCQVFTCVWGKV